MKNYRNLKFNPITFDVTPNAKEVIFECVSVMDNPKQIRFKKIDGEFIMLTGGDAFSNFQFRNQVSNRSYSKPDFTWIADEGKWNEVANLIRTGTIEIESVKSR